MLFAGEHPENPVWPVAAGMKQIANKDYTFLLCSTMGKGIAKRVQKR